MAETLKKELRFGDRHVLVYTSDARRAYLPTTGNIVKALKYVAKRAGPGDTFVMFFAGYGVM
ncbi:MAG: caspase family protein [Deltaproteobacteria bacterium]|nr:caspase family protein [Deltaproteobacteria bacterium]